MTVSTGSIRFGAGKEEDVFMNFIERTKEDSSLLAIASSKQNLHCVETAYVPGQLLNDGFMNALVRVPEDERISVGNLVGRGNGGFHPSESLGNCFYSFGLEMRHSFGA